MSDPIEEKMARKIEAAAGPAVVKGEAFMHADIPERLIAFLIYVITALWWPCRFYHPQFKGWGLIETFCVIVMVLGPFANLLLLMPLLISGAKTGWPHKGWIALALLCAASAWPLVLASGLIGHEPVYAH
jgi:hypothetical protein